MDIIEYFSTDNKEHWLSKIKESDWGAGQFLYGLLKDQKLKQLVGDNVKVLNHAEALAREAGNKNIYISTNHVGLYEKYGYEFFEVMKDMHGEDSRVYVRDL